MQTDAAPDLPLPPPELMARMSGNGEPEAEAFVVSGRQTVEDWTRALRAVGVELESATRMLDWGCGPGRVTRWLDKVGSTVEIHGVDIDHQSIEWDRAHLPFASFQRVEALPPLPFDDDYFDLVVNHSVMTHLDEGMQDLWLAELARVTAPGGTVLLTVHGESAYQQSFENARAAGHDVPNHLVDLLGEKGILYTEDDWWTGGPYPTFYHTAYHSPAYVFAHWSAFLDVRAYLPRADGNFQDIVILTPRVNDAPAPSSFQSRPAPPEEIDHLGNMFTLASVLIEQGPSASSPTRFGPVTRMARRAVARMTRHQEQHQREVDRALLTTAAGVRDTFRSGDDTSRVRQLLNEIATRQAQRIGRLEDQVVELAARLAEREQRE